MKLSEAARADLATTVRPVARDPPSCAGPPRAIDADVGLAGGGGGSKQYPGRKTAAISPSRAQADQVPLDGLRPLSPRAPAR